MLQVSIDTDLQATLEATGASKGHNTASHPAPELADRVPVRTAVVADVPYPRDGASRIVFVKDCLSQWHGGTYCLVPVMSRCTIRELGIRG